MFTCRWKEWGWPHHLLMMIESSALASAYVQTTATVFDVESRLSAPIAAPRIQPKTTGGPTLPTLPKNNLTISSSTQSKNGSANRSATTAISKLQRPASFDSCGTQGVVVAALAALLQISATAKQPTAARVRVVAVNEVASPVRRVSRMGGCSR